MALLRLLADLRLNRTFMELKQLGETKSGSQAAGLNRTFMELKPGTPTKAGWWAPAS